MIGDGYSTVYHCENCPDTQLECLDPDAGPIYCYSQMSELQRRIDKILTSDRLRRVLDAIQFMCFAWVCCCLILLAVLGTKYAIYKATWTTVRYHQLQ